jgi:hypothetical protein
VRVNHQSERACGDNDDGDRQSQQQKKKKKKLYRAGQQL